MIIEPDGAVVPLEYGFARAYALGNFHDAPLAELARSWQAAGYPAFQRLCRRALRTVAEKVDEPLANWFEEVREQSALAVA